MPSATPPSTMATAIRQRPLMVSPVSTDENTSAQHAPAGKPAPPRRRVGPTSVPRSSRRATSPARQCRGGQSAAHGRGQDRREGGGPAVGHEGPRAGAGSAGSGSPRRSPRRWRTAGLAQKEIASAQLSADRSAMATAKTLALPSIVRAISTTPTMATARPPVGRRSRASFEKQCREDEREDSFVWTSTEEKTGGNPACMAKKGRRTLRRTGTCPCRPAPSTTRPARE